MTAVDTYVPVSVAMSSRARGLHVCWAYQMASTRISRPSASVLSTW